MAITLADIRARIVAKLNRSNSNITVSQLNAWIGDAVRRIQQTIRLPIDETRTQALIPEGFNGLIDIPGDLTELLSLRVNGVELEQRHITEVNALTEVKADQSLYYTRVVGQYRIAPLPAVGSLIELEFRRAIEPGSADDSTIHLFDLKPDLVEFAALVSAADHFGNMQGIAKWTELYNQAFLELQTLASRDDFQNASMAPAYNFDCNRF